MWRRRRLGMTGGGSSPGPVRLTLANLPNHPHNPQPLKSPTHPPTSGLILPTITSTAGRPCVAQWLFQKSPQSSRARSTLYANPHFLPLFCPPLPPATPQLNLLQDAHSSKSFFSGRQDVRGLLAARMREATLAIRGRYSSRPGGANNLRPLTLAR